MPSSFLRFRVPLGFLFAGWYLWLTRYVSAEGLAWGLPFILGGCALRSSAAGYLFKGKRVAVGGPYAYVRNPLYVGSFLIGTGFWIALGRWPLPWQVLLFGMIYVGGFVGLYVAKGRAEENELEQALGTSYTVYRSQVPAFLPFRGHVGGLGEQHFSRELYRKNREYECLIGSAALLIFLLWRIYGG